MISGALAGIGGMIFSVPNSEFGATVEGYGFLALAVLIFGQWKPIRIMIAAFFFGLMKTISVTYTSIAITINNSEGKVVHSLSNLPIPSAVYKMIPYIATLIVLAFTSRNSMAPKASGIPYDKGSR